jgi:hypothetical protein
MSTAAQIAANQKNSQLSTGPTSEAGKAKSSLNAVRSGLTGRTVLLPGDDAALYESHVSHFIESYAPVGDDERNLVQSLADTAWRLLRIPSLEMGIYAIGRLEFAGSFPNEDEAVRKHLIEAQVFLAYQRQLNNLSIQENRLAASATKTPPRSVSCRRNANSEPKRVWILPPVNIFVLSRNSRTSYSTRPRLASNFHSPKSSAGPSISIPIPGAN